MAVKLTDLKLQDFQDFDNHERVVLIEDDTTKLTAVVSIHNNNLGPAMGGCRFYPYKTREEGYKDVLRLSRGMTYKSALANLALGGGKSIIFGDARADKTRDMLQSFGEGLEKLGGAYITAEDVGTNEADMLTISSQTSYVMGLPPSADNPLSGNPSPHTSQGVFTALEGLANEIYDDANALRGKRCGVMGLGAVGYGVAQKLNAAGAQLIVADINTEACARAEAEFADVKILGSDELLKTELDIFVPCAMGGVFDLDTIALLKTEIICGAANNQLATGRAEDRALYDGGMIYAPDYVVNAGGIIAVAYAYYHATDTNPYAWDLTPETLAKHVESIRATTLNIFNISRENNTPPGFVADELAENIFRNGVKPDLKIA